MTPAGVVTDGNSGNNYSYTFVNSTNGTITTKALTVTAADASKCFGTTYTLGTSAFASTGLLSGETIGSVSLTSSGAGSGAAAGTYNIVPSAAIGGTFSASNYTITYTSGTLTVNGLPTAPTGTNGSRCSTGTVNLSATVSGGETIDWYSASSGGTLLLSGSTSYTTPSISTTTLYYAEARNIATGCVSNSRTTVTATVYPTSVGGTVTGGLSICSGSTSGVLTLSGNTGSVVRWEYSVSPFTSWTTIANTSTTFTSGALTQTTHFRAVVQSGICSEANSVETVVSILTTTWNGSSWNNGVPTSTTAVVFTGNYTAAANISACSITVTSSAIVTIPSTFNVILSGSLTVSSGSFTLNNNANLLQTTNAANSGNIIVKRNTNPLIRLDYTLWSSPVSGQGLYAFSPLTFSNRFYKYNTTIVFPAITGFYSNSVGFNITGLDSNGVNGTDSNNVPFATGTGYLIRLPWNHPTAATIWNGQFTGVPNNGTQNVTITDTGDRFNAVGNPFPSPISISQLATDNSSSIETTLYFWRKTNNTASPSYCSWNTASNTFGDNGEAYTDSPLGVIQTGQGFFVQAKTGATNLVFNNGQRIGNNANQFFRTSESAATNPTTIEANRIWLNMTGATSGFSQSVVGYFTNATIGVDDFDSKYFNDGPIAFTSTIANQDYVIQGRAVPFDVSDVVPMKYKVTTAGDYTITIDHVDGLFAGGSQAVYLRDNVTGTINDLNTGAYTFTSAAGTFDSRFEILYQMPLHVDTPTFNANQVVIYKNEVNDLVINSGNVMMTSVKIFDIRGRLLVEKKGINASQTNMNVSLANEVLLVQITSVDGAMVTKKVVR